MSVNAPRPEESVDRDTRWVVRSAAAGPNRVATTGIAVLAILGACTSCASREQAPVARGDPRQVVTAYIRLTVHNDVAGAARLECPRPDGIYTDATAIIADKDTTYVVSSVRVDGNHATAVVDIRGRGDQPGTRKYTSLTLTRHDGKYCVDQ